jgi:arylformamidase
MPPEWIDLSQPIFTGMPHAKPHGDVRIWVEEPHVPAPAHLRITHLEMATHIGTHIDAACHFFADGKSIERYPREKFMGPGVALDLRREGVLPVTTEELENATPKIQAGDIVLFYFGYAERFGKEEIHGHPYLSEDAARWLVNRDVPIVGFDVFTPDLPDGFRPDGFNWPVHRILLGNDTLVIENLGPGLRDVAGHRLEILAVPFALEGADASPLVPLARVVD